MANFEIDPTRSVFTASGDAFNFDSPGADALIIDAGAYLYATVGSGAHLANTGAWNVTVDGSIFADDGMLLASGDATPSTIRVGSHGQVVGIFDGIDLLSPATITNSGTIAGNNTGISISGVGLHTIKNSGIISGQGWAITSGNAGTQLVVNTGVIKGYVLFGDGNGGGGDDTFIDFAKVGHRIVSGTIQQASVDLGGGEDKFLGGSKVDSVVDGGAADLYKLGSGNDYYGALYRVGTDGHDTINGGKGIDTYDARDATSGININLDSVVHDASKFGGPGYGFVDSKTATGVDVAGSSSDTITGFENVNGGSGSDFIHGNAESNILDSGGGFDWLLGYGGRDTLIGGAGTNEMVGGSASDTLIGGTGTDYFTFWAVTDSGTTKSTRDVIENFQTGTDRISLDKIDANTKLANDQAFTLLTTVGAHFTGHAGPNGEGELRFYNTGMQTIIEGDVNHDKKADFSIALDGFHALTAGDFFL